MRNDLRKRFRWFLPRVGGIFGQRAKTAIDLARAEIWASDQALETVWQFDQDGDLGDHAYWCAAAKRGERCEHVIEWCALIRPCDDHGIDCRHAETLASLGGIIDADSEYRRIVAAELASEAMAS